MIVSSSLSSSFPMIITLLFTLLLLHASEIYGFGFSFSHQGYGHNHDHSIQIQRSYTKSHGRITVSPLHPCRSMLNAASQEEPSHSQSHSPSALTSRITNRRSILHQLPTAMTMLTLTLTTGLPISMQMQPEPAYAKTAPSTSISNLKDDLQTIIDAAETLNKLLTNWDKATIDCTYADVPRELLEQKNKDLLLEKASTFALFDKSTSVVSCKKTNKIVRDYIGVTGKGPLVNIERKMLKRNFVDVYVDGDDLDEYYYHVENFQSAIARASSLSYAASTDFDSVNNFDKEEKESKSKNGGGGDSGSGSSTTTLSISSDNSNLEQARKAISEAKNSIDQIVSILVTESS